MNLFTQQSIQYSYVRAQQQTNRKEMKTIEKGLERRVKSQYLLELDAHERTSRLADAVDYPTIKWI